MANQIETGHAKNLANFDELYNRCTAYLPQYNPSKDALTLPKLEEQRAACREALNAAQAAKATFDVAVNERREAFERLRPLATRLTNALSVSGATEKTVDNARSIQKKIQGIRATPRPVKEEGTTGEEPKTISSSQQSYDLLREHLYNYIQLLVLQPSYRPNEEDLKIDTLKAYHLRLTELNTRHIVTSTAWSSARLRRDQLFYHPVTGLVQIASEVKTYVKSVFGPSAPEYRQLTALEFIPMT